MSGNIREEFQKFVGLEVSTVKRVREYKVPKTRVTPDGSFQSKSVEAAPDDPVLRDMKRVADEGGINLRILLPGHLASCDWDPTRLNIAVRTDADGKWRVSDNFTYG